MQVLKADAEAVLQFFMTAEEFLAWKAQLKELDERLDTMSEEKLLAMID